MEDLENEIYNLKELIIKNDKNKIIDFFNTYNIVDMAELVDELVESDLAYLFNNLDLDLAGDLFTYINIQQQIKLLDIISKKRLSDIIDNIYTDDAVEFLEDLPKEVIDDILSYSDSFRKKTLLEMLSHPEDSAGSLMSTDYIDIGQYLSVKAATELLNKNQDLVENLDNIYVTDTNQMLVGVVSIREILFAPDDDLIDYVMTKEVIRVNVNDFQEDVVKVFKKYSLSQIPVVDNENKLLGFISADDIIDVLEEEATEDIHKMGGIVYMEGSYLHTSAKDMAKNRILWLIILTIAYTVSSFIITGYSNLIATVPSLMVFVALLMNTAGDAGSQALAMVVRGIAVDGIDTSYFKKVVKKEFGVALISGFVLFVGNMIRIMYFSTNTGNIWLAFVVSITVFFVVIIAKLIGGILPLVALFLKQDPAAMASPLITTLSDSISLILYFSIAKLFLERLV